MRDERPMSSDCERHRQGSWPPRKNRYWHAVERRLVISRGLPVRLQIFWTWTLRDARA